jgi:hypothetical protein
VSGLGVIMCLSRTHRSTTKAVKVIVREDLFRVEMLGVLSAFRTDVYDALWNRRDALFELVDALLCTDGPVKSLVDLVLAPEHRRGHGGMYDALNHGWIEVERLRRTLAGVALPRAAGGRIVLAVDTSAWLRPDAGCSPDRLFCHVYGRAKNNAQMIPGWQYSFIAALESGRTSWTAILDALRLGPADDVAEITAGQIRGVVERIITAGHHVAGDPAILIVLDSGYDIPRLAYVLSDLPVEVLGRLRSDRVMHLPTPPRLPGTNGRPYRHGPELALADPGTWPTPHLTTSTATTRYGTATATAWDRIHPRLTHRTCWLEHAGALPIIEGTLIRLQVDHLPGDRNPKPVWLWYSATATTDAQVDRAWQTYLRRFDLEHTFRFLKQVLGWNKPLLRDPAAADRWTLLVIIAHTQLRLARHLTDDLRRPWEKPAPPDQLTPARVRRGFRHIHQKTAQPAHAPKPCKPGPGRPPGSPNRHRAPVCDVGKTATRAKSITAHKQSKG